MPNEIEKFEQEREEQRLIAPRGPSPEQASIRDSFRAFDSRFGSEFGSRPLGLGRAALGRPKQPAQAEAVFKDEATFEAVKKDAVASNQPLKPPGIKRDPFTPGLGALGVKVDYDQIPKDTPQGISKEMIPGSKIIKSAFAGAGLNEPELVSGRRDLVAKGKSTKPSFHETGDALDFSLKGYNQKQLRALSAELDKTGKKVGYSLWQFGETTQDGKFSGFEVLIHKERGGLHLHMERQTPESSKALKEYMQTHTKGKL